MPLRRRHPRRRMLDGRAPRPEGARRPRQGAVPVDRLRRRLGGRALHVRARRQRRICSATQSRKESSNNSSGRAATIGSLWLTSGSARSASSARTSGSARRSTACSPSGGATASPRHLRGHHYWSRLIGMNVLKPYELGDALDVRGRPTKYYTSDQSWFKTSIKPKNGQLEEQHFYFARENRPRWVANSTLTGPELEEARGVPVLAVAGGGRHLSHVPRSGAGWHRSRRRRDRIRSRSAAPLRPARTGTPSRRRRRPPSSPSPTPSGRAAPRTASPCSWSGAGC